MKQQYNDIWPSGKAISKAQWHFFKRCLEETPPDQLERRAAFERALEVNYWELPDNARSKSKAKPTPQAVQSPAPRIDTIKSGTSVCYLVRQPTPVFFISAVKVWDALKRAMPTLKRSQVLTLKEAKSFLELGGEKIKSLKQAAELWASEPPLEPMLPQPKVNPVNAASGGWVDGDEYDFA